MKHMRYGSLWKGLAAGCNLLAAVLAAAGFCAIAGSGGGPELWKDVFQGEEYIESEEFQNQASEEIYKALEAAARSTRLEENGAYDPDKLIRLRDYLESRAVYEEIPESEKDEGIVYRLGDLYQWSLKGMSFQDDVLQESYKPLFYGSIQEYANECDEAYNVLVDQLSQAMEMLKQDISVYQADQKVYSYEATNVRYALWDMGNGGIYTNVPALQKEGSGQEELEGYFKGFGSYYIFDSRSASVAQQNIGDYYSYNTHALLTSWQIHLEGEYQVYVGIDTAFPVSDALAAGALAFEEARNILKPSLKILAAGVFLWLLTFLFLSRTSGKETSGNPAKAGILDSWFLEPALLLLLLTAVLYGRGILLLHSLIGADSLIRSVWLAGAFALVEDGLFLIGWCGLLRRLRRGELWKRSLCGLLGTRLYHFTAEALEHSHAAFRIGAGFLAYELLQALYRLLFGTLPGAEAVLFLLKALVLALLIREGIQRQKVLEGVRAMAAGNGEARISSQGMSQANREMSEAVNDLGEGLRNAMQEQMKSERMKADLITNVSHDLKTPLTSIINYVDLMKREQVDNPRVREYLQVLDQKSQRLKQLTEDLVEASRASSGNVSLDMQKIDLKELLLQTGGEFEEKFAARGLTLVADYPASPVYIVADGRRLWRIIENLYRNVEKYAMPNTRVYLDVACEGRMASLSMKNISEQPLNISAEELTERFARGDESRSTEGSGLGLSIAKDLTELQGGTFTVYLDGDLFKVRVSFPQAEPEIETETD